MSDWFTIDHIDDKTHIISEYKHWEESHAYLLEGMQCSLLIDTGLGIMNLYDEVIKLTDKPIVAVATHIHWDHIGGHKYFPDFYVHEDEVNWLSGEFPLSLEQIREYVVERCQLPVEFHIDDYEFFQGNATRVLKDGDMIEIGGRSIQVVHTPGHSPDICVFMRKAEVTFLQVIWFIRIRCLHIIRPPTRQHIWLLWRKFPRCLSPMYFLHTMI